MDGAVILDRDATRILRGERAAGARPVHPDRGVRHPAPHRRAGRQADRLPGHLGQPVDADHRPVRRRPPATCSRTPATILSRANQALATLERYKMRLDEVSGTLSALEIEDLVTVRDVAAVAQRLEMVRRIAGEIEGYVVELGTDGRLLVAPARRADRRRGGRPRRWSPATTSRRSGGRRQRTVAAGARRPRRARPRSSCWTSSAVARALGHSGAGEMLDTAVTPRGLPAARPGAAPAGRRGRPAGRALRHPAEAARRRASTTCRPSRAWARAGPGPCARACPGWPSRRSSSGTSDLQVSAVGGRRRAAGEPSPARTRRSTSSTGRLLVVGRPQHLEHVRRQPDRTRRRPSPTNASALDHGEHAVDGDADPGPPSVPVDHHDDVAERRPGRPATRRSTTGSGCPAARSGR